MHHFEIQQFCTKQLYGCYNGLASFAMHLGVVTNKRMWFDDVGIHKGVSYT